MGVNGKNKGNTFERKIANLFSDRFKEHTGLEKGFYRNADSGSYFGGSNQQRVQTHNTEFAVYGDLVCPKKFKFSVECKHYKKPPSLQSILNYNVKEWDDWLAQAEQDAANSGKTMMLLVKYNNTDTMLFSLYDLELSYIIKYKHYHIYKLDDVLELPNTFFFDE